MSFGGFWPLGLGWGWPAWGWPGLAWAGFGPWGWEPWWGVWPDPLWLVAASLISIATSIAWDGVYPYCDPYYGLYYGYGYACLAYYAGLPAYGVPIW